MAEPTQQTAPVTTLSLSLLAVLGLCIEVCSEVVDYNLHSQTSESINETSLVGLISTSSEHYVADELTRGQGVAETQPTAAPIQVEADSIREPNQPQKIKSTDDKTSSQQRKPGALLRVVCSFDSASPSRKNNSMFLIQNMSASLCTDLYYEHAVITDDTNEIQAISKLDIFPLDGNMYIPSFVAINDFKIKFPGLRTFLTIVESSKISFGDFTHGSDKLKSFVQSCLKQTRIWGFDGINIKWRRLPNLGSLSHILHHLKIAFEQEVTLTKLPKLLLGVTFFGDIRQFQDLEEASHINSLVDQVTLLAFNLAEESATETHLKSPLYPLRHKETPLKPPLNPPLNPPRQTGTKDGTLSPRESMNIASNESDLVNGTHERAERLTTKNTPVAVTEDPLRLTTKNTPVVVTDGPLNVTTERTFIDNLTEDTELESPRTTRQTGRYDVNLKEALESLVKYGVSKSKINVAISLTGQSYTLKDAAVHGIGAPITEVGSLYDKVGQVDFTDMCNVKSGTKMRASEEDDTPYWFHERFWISYEDLQSIRQKIDYVTANHVGGIAILSQSEDDFSGENCNSGPFPVSNMLYNLSNMGFHLRHYAYSFPWAEYCGGLGAAAVGDGLLVAHGVVVSVLAVIWL